MAPGLDDTLNTKIMAGNDVSDDFEDDLFYEDNEEDLEEDDDYEVDNILLTFSPTKLNGICEDKQHLFVDDLDSSGRMMMANPNKVVKFADDEEKKMDDQRDRDRSRQELLSKIARLTDLLAVAEKQLSTEKEKRKKKEKTLMKLAKELKKRMSQKDKDTDRLEELEEKKKYLEHHWVLAQKELDQEKVLRAKLHTEARKEYEQSIQEERSKHAKTVEEHEVLLVELKKAHAKQCDELCREILKANVEADRLHNELKSKGVNIPRHALFKDANSAQNSPYSYVIATFITFFFATLWFLGSKVDMFTMSGLCAPIMPGSVLSDNVFEQTFQAPWWAPESQKKDFFEKVCAVRDPLREPTSIHWSRDGKNNKLTLIVDGKVTLQRSIFKAEFAGSNIRLWKRNGHAEDFKTAW